MRNDRCQSNVNVGFGYITLAPETSRFRCVFRIVRFLHVTENKTGPAHDYGNTSTNVYQRVYAIFGSQ